jgi:ABC-type transporter Mla MlaB component
MTQQDSDAGGLLSRVAKFVRHPTVDWSDLDQRSQGMDAEREALKAAIARKRRNDKVRHRELNQLREVMLAKLQPRTATPSTPASADTSASVLPSAHYPPASKGADTSKSRTIEQIARIEQQMSDNWPRRQSQRPAEGLRIDGQSPGSPRGDGDMTQPAHLGARTRGAAGRGIPIDVVASDPNALAQGEVALSHPALAEAAVRFANGELDAAEKGLRLLLVQEPLSPTARVAGLALLDLLHARRHFEGFEEFAAEFADRFGTPVPRWPTDVHSTPSRSTIDAPVPDMLAPSTWTCPLFLDASGLASLSRTLSSPGRVKWLDWTGLLSADVQAAEALLREVTPWLQRPLELHFLGGAVLRRRLKASTPSGRRENDPVWWLLRLAFMQIMHRRDEFDLVALDYCVTYGVTPPEWIEPLCQFQLADSMPVESPRLESPEPIQPLPSLMGGLDVLEWPSMVTTMHGSETQFPSADTALASDWPTTLPAISGAAARLFGFLSGEMLAATRTLDDALAAHPPGKLFVVDCQLLERVDFSAAGTLLQWLMAAMAKGTPIELRGVSRLVAAFFHVVGIDEAVSVRLRQY